MRRLIILFLILLTGCKIGSLPDKNLSKSNISYIELTFPNSKNKIFPIRLDPSKINLFIEIFKNRKEGNFDPTNCYNLYIQLKDGSSVSYMTDGLKFQGYDDSSDLPFSFETKKDILKEVFKLKEIEKCK